MCALSFFFKIVIDLCKAKGRPYTSGAQLGAVFCPPGNIWQHLETFLIVTTGWKMFGI